MQSDAGAIETIDDLSTLSADERRDRADSLVTRADEAGRNGDVSTEDDRLADLRRLAEATESETITRSLARALANATDTIDRDDAYRKATPHVRIEDIVDELSTLADDIDAVTVEYARGLANAIDDRSATDGPDAGEELVDRLREVTDADDPELARYLARGLVNEARRHAMARSNDDGGEIGREVIVLEEVTDLYETHATDGLAHEHARILKITSIAHGIADRYDEQANTLGELINHYDRHRTDAVAENLAWALMIAAEDAGERNKYRRMESRIDRVEGLYDDHPTDDIASTLARAYRSLASAEFRDRRHPDRGADLVDEIESLYRDHHNAVASEFATALALAIGVHAENESFQRAEVQLDRLETLARSRSDDEDVAEELFGARMSLAEAYVYEGDLERARRKFPENPTRRNEAFENIDAIDDRDDAFSLFVLMGQVEEVDADDTSEWPDRSDEDSEETDDWYDQFGRPVTRRSVETGTIGLAIATLLIGGSVFALPDFAIGSAFLGLFDPVVSTLAVGPLADMTGIISRLLLAGVGFGGLMVHYHISTRLSLGPVYVPTRPLDGVVVPTHVEGDGDRIFTGFSVMALFMARIGLLVTAVIGSLSTLAVVVLAVAIWVTVDLVLEVVLLGLILVDWAIFSISSVASEDILSTIDLAPIDAERMSYQAVREGITE